MSSLSRTSSCVLLALLVASPAAAQPLTWSRAGGSENWPAWARDAVTRSMDEAVAEYNRYGYFPRHLTANYNAGVPTAQANYDGWIDFGGSYNTRVAIHEIAHALGTGTYWGFNGGNWSVDSAAGRLIKLYDGQGAVLSTGGSHFWPYGVNYDNEDGAAARERHCKLVAAFRFDMGIVVDSDKDGIPDDWEQFHFGGLSETAQGDPDKDGITNLDEYNSDSHPKQACPVVDGHVYVIRSQITRRALSVAGASTAEGAPTKQHEADRKPWQQWTAKYLGKGFWRLINVNSGKVLEVPGTDTASARPIQQASANDSLQQQWRIVSGPGANAGYWQIANRETGRVVDCLDGAEGAAVLQYPFLGNLQQQFWTFEEVQSQQDAGVGSDAGAMLADASVSDASTSDAAPTGTGAASTDAAITGDKADAGLEAGAPRTNEGDDDDDSSSGCSVASGAAQTRLGLALLIALAGLLIARRRRTVSA